MINNKKMPVLVISKAKWKWKLTKLSIFIMIFYYNIRVNAYFVTHDSL